ncbi:MAG: hypothetical protein L6V93_08565 [Clostridiales bacterium]|nr:MAG: hypothetical protein L6V93_08565 [Clostridiales bacterium]
MVSFILGGANVLPYSLSGAVFEYGGYGLFFTVMKTFRLSEFAFRALFQQHRTDFDRVRNAGELRSALLLYISCARVAYMRRCGRNFGRQAF